MMKKMLSWIFWDRFPQQHPFWVNIQDKPLLLAAFFSFIFHGILASFLISSFQKFSPKQVATIEVIWEKIDSSPHNCPQNKRNPKKSIQAKENKSVSLQKSFSQIKNTNYLSHNTHTNHNDSQTKENSSPEASRLISFRKAYQPLPSYPWICRKRGQEGKVVVHVKTNDVGNVIEVNLHKSSGYSRLDEAALEAIKTWTFAERYLQKILILDFRLKG